MIDKVWNIFIKYEIASSQKTLLAMTALVEDGWVDYWKIIISCNVMVNCKSGEIFITKTLLVRKLILIFFP